MASAQDLKKRIKSVTNTQQITKAMKMVASARLRRAQQKAQGTAPYAERLGRLLRQVAGSAEEAGHPLLERRKVKKICYLIVGADKGLAGPYTSNLMKRTLELLESGPESRMIIAVGRKPIDYLTHRNISISTAMAGFSDKPDFDHAQELTEMVTNLFISKEVDEVVMVYTYFINSLTQEVHAERLLPVETPEGEASAEREQDFIFVPNQEAIFSELLPRFLEITVYNGLLQSAASELGARMTAMTSATDNASDLISALDLQYNKLRQAGITNEISEIVGGANALQ